MLDALHDVYRMRVIRQKKNRGSGKIRCPGWCVMYFVLREEGEETVEQAEVLKEDLEAHEDEHDAAGHFGFRLILGAENIADLDADGGEYEGGDADEQHGRYDVDLQEGEGDADREGIDAGGYGEGEHRFEGEGAVEFVCTLTGFLDHVGTDEGEQDEGDPVVKAFDHGLEADAEQVADGGHKRLKATEIRADDDHVLGLCFLHGEALTNGHGAGIHGKSDREDEQF